MRSREKKEEVTASEPPPSLRTPRPTAFSFPPRVTGHFGERPARCLALLAAVVPHLLSPVVEAAAEAAGRLLLPGHTVRPDREGPGRGAGCPAHRPVQGARMAPESGRRDAVYVGQGVTGNSPALAEIPAVQNVRGKAGVESQEDRGMGPPPGTEWSC